jgi:starch-binding outer membrane protein, SusD/RagB family
MKILTIAINKLVTPIFIISILVPAISCKKYIQIQPAPNLIGTEQVFTNDKTALSAVAGVYYQMRSSPQFFSNGGMSFFGGLSADEIQNTSSSPTWSPYYKNSLISTLSSIKSNFWSPAYRNIYSINSILEGLEKSNTISDSINKQLKGEMKVTRAFYYFYLVNLFGDVPLITGTDYQVNSQMPRTPINNVYQQIINDLVDAKTLLEPAYPSMGKVRPNKWAAAALLARVYLYKKDWHNAEAQATEVINGGYALQTNLDNVFLINSPETIWEMTARNEEVNTGQGANFVPFSANSRPTFALTSSLLNSFETGDKRRVSWIKSNTVNGVVYNYPYKYKEARATTPLKEYNVMLRLSEQYLIRAEARAQQNKFPDAQSDLNQIRNRAGLGNTTAATQADLLTTIDHERQTELFTEWGDRWLNLKRRELADAVLAQVKGSNWQPGDKLYPIPFDQLQYDVFLSQNPGY